MAKINNIKYFEAVGRRKTSVARVRLFEESLPVGKVGTSSPQISVNDKPHTIYFPTAPLKKIAEEALKAA
ncbi:30S ribosomal protein S9, partial [Candidatus Giovannonibacteria bacterium RIFCSPHIGHO2_01_FULL_43_140]